jgi:flagellar motor protein MotB
MERYHDRSLAQDSLNIFQPFTDLMSNAFMIITFFLLLSLFQALALNKSLQSVSPIIIDEKSGKFKFKSGSAELPLELKKRIDADIPKIRAITKERKIEFIQVIGHTDGQSINNSSNLDQKLELAARGKQPVGKLQAGSNSDLGLMRAIAVIQALQKSGQLKNIDFRAYSAAQLYLPSGKLAPVNRSADGSRRRIEIRFVPPGQQK